MVERHAYLIISHTNFNQLGLLLQTLDEENNDIYLLIDKRVKNPPKEFLSNQVTNARLFFVRPVKVSWGGDSLIKAELRLLRSAIHEKHLYYHLISGMDLPIKPQKDIVSFFRENDGQNFVSLELNNEYNINNRTLHRVDYYYFFQNIIGRNETRISHFFKKIQDYLVSVQEKKHISRTKNKNLVFIKGCNWFSITHEAAEYVVDYYSKNKSLFRFTLLSDEMVLQTILYNSYLSSTIANKNLRLIDWKRGSPYVFRNDDFELLIGAREDKLFARKFDERVDDVVIKRICNYLYNC